MTTNTATVVVEGHILELTTVTSEEADRVEVAWIVDGVALGTRREPDWRPIRIGVGGGTYYWWSAWHLVAISPGRLEHVVAVEDDEILLVFRRPNAWVLVCETSLQIVTDDATRSRFEFGEVVTASHWDGDNIVVRDFTDRTWVLRIDGVEAIWCNE